MTGSNIARAGLVVLSLGLAAGPAQAAMSSFLAMAGSWAGGGTLSMANGEREPLRCRAAYEPAGRGETLRLNLRCASASYNFDLASEVQDRGGTLSGWWTESSHNASGSISGRVAGDHIEAAAQGQDFAANLSLTTHGNRQFVSIRPQGTDVRAVSLSLERR